MNVAGLNVRITFQKSITCVDSALNHTSEWEDYFTCWATAVASGQGDKSEEAAHTVEENRMDFTVRYCSDTAAITAKGYRIIFMDRIYDIDSVDDMAFKRHSLKFHATRKERS